MPPHEGVGLAAGYVGYVSRLTYVYLDLYERVTSAVRWLTTQIASSPNNMALRTLLSLAAIAGAAIGTQKPIGGPGAKSRDPFTPDFDDFLDGVLKDWKVAGASIAVVDGDKVYAKVRGENA